MEKEKCVLGCMSTYGDDDVYVWHMLTATAPKKTPHRP